MYETDEDLPGLFGVRSSPDIPLVSPNGSCLPGSLYLPQIHHTENKQETPEKDGNEEIPLASGVEDIEDVDSDIVGTDTIETLDLSISMPDVPQVHTPSEGEHSAALKIQEGYKRALLRRYRTTRTGLSAILQRIFTACLASANQIGWQNSYYRLLFLGPLPHLLVCLEIALVATTAQKVAAKKRLFSERHQGLEDLGSRLTQIG